MHPIHTIGHSTHPIETFIALPRSARVDMLADVRSHPGSRWNPQFNQRALARALDAAGILYVHLGRELGGHPGDKGLLRPSSTDGGGRPDYDLIAESAPFREGIARLRALAENARVAIMCAEKDPLHCHRTKLVAPALVAAGLSVRHIHADGRIEDHARLMERLAADTRQDDLFAGLTRETANS